jgi:transcriptional regulator with XRE-family HTH domain
MINLFLSFLRQQADNTLEKIAELLEVEPDCYRMLEDGSKSPTDAQLEKLSQVFGISPDWLQAAAKYSERLRYCEEQLRKKDWTSKMLLCLVQLLKPRKRLSNLK